MTEFITVDDPKKLPDVTLRCWTTIEEVERNHPGVPKVYVYTPNGAYSYYYVPVMED